MAHLIFRTKIFKNCKFFISIYLHFSFRLRWRPTSLIRRHSATEDKHNPNSNKLPSTVSKHSMTPSPSMIPPSHFLTPSPQNAPPKERPFVITPISNSAKKKLFRSNLAALAKQLSPNNSNQHVVYETYDNYPNYPRTATLVTMDDEFADPRLSPATSEASMIRSSVF